MSAVQDAAGDYVGSEVDYQRKLRTMQLWNYAIASGLPSIPASPAPSPAAPAPNPAPATASATATTTSSGIGTLAKAGILAGTLATGGGLVGIGTFLGGAFSSPAPAVAPAGATGQVTIGIDDTGHLVNPGAAP